MKQYKSRHPGRDILSGIIVALVSIPISMGYAQIAGLPPVYGLYGSLLPILAFSLLTTSPQFVVDVYFVSNGSENLIMQFYQEHYEKNIQLISCGEIDGYQIWKYTEQ